MIISPLNYPGNKAKALKEILSIIPSETDTIIEIFAGSALVSLNSNSKNIILNDFSKKTIELLNYFNKHKGDEIEKEIDLLIKKFDLTNTHKNGKEKYPILKYEGLSKYNKKGYLKLREEYNRNPSSAKLFALIIYGFNHYIRFNSKNKFNVPVGKVDYSTSLRKKTYDYAKAFKNKKVKFYNSDFRDKKLYQMEKNCLYYFDPPYLITEAPYNASWTEKDEEELLNLLDELNEKNIRFALSNVIQSNGKTNKILKEWAKKYKIIEIKRQYRNANYRRKNKSDTIEVIIINY